MAAAVNLVNPRYNVNGNEREQYYNVTLNSGDTLEVGINDISTIDFFPAVCSAFAIASNGPGLGSTITFTLTSNVTSAPGAFITVRGH